MRSLYKILNVALVGFLLTGCEKYVDIKTQGQLTPSETINYRYLLNNTSAYETGPRISDLSSNDVNIVDGSTQQLALAGSASYAWFANSYTWQAPYPVNTTAFTDYEWNGMYNTIAYCNTVTTEVPSSTGGTDADKAELIAEALVHRADAYLMLINTYAKPYNAATATSDPGVPLLTQETTVQSLVRAPVQTVYNQIIADLKNALPALPKTQTFNTLPSKASAYGELARCYLYMNDYTNASKYADSTLALRSTLNDLGAITVVNASTYPLRKFDPEILLSKIPYGGIPFAPTVIRLSDDLLTLLGTKDQRYNLFTCLPSVITSSYTAAGGRFFYRDKVLNEGRNIGPSVPEMMLIKAEAYARSGDAGNAMLWVNNLRKKRFKAADYADLTATSANDALVKVIDERHREFFCRMLRWWDMRRLKSETQFQKTYTRTFAGVTYTLDPASNKYTFQIAGYLIGLNPEIVQNP